MLNDPAREQNNVVVNTFGNSEIPEKFNNHNVGEYLIPVNGVLPDAEPIVTQYLRKNEIAKKLVAKWFNRTPDGSFDMKLIAERGQV